MMCGQDNPEWPRYCSTVETKVTAEEDSETRSALFEREGTKVAASEMKAADTLIVASKEPLIARLGDMLLSRVLSRFRMQDMILLACLRRFLRAPSIHKPQVGLCPHRHWKSTLMIISLRLGQLKNTILICPTSAPFCWRLTFALSLEVIRDSLALFTKIGQIHRRSKLWTDWNFMQKDETMNLLECLALFLCSFVECCCWCCHVDAHEPADVQRTCAGANQRLKLNTNGTWVFAGVFWSCTAFFICSWRNFYNKAIEWTKQRPRPKFTASYHSAASTVHWGRGSHAFLLEGHFTRGEISAVHMTSRM